MLAAFIGAAVLVAQGPLITLALRLIGGSASVQHEARLYCAARIWAAPLALANYVVLGYLLGCQRVRLALLSQVVINLVNIGAVWLYVYGFDWGIAGIGAATASADAAGFLLGAALLWWLRPRGMAPVGWAILFDRLALKRLVIINRDIFVRTLCLLASFGWFAHAGASQGDITLAANALLLNFQTFMAYGLDGFAHAAEALVGAAIGARDRAALRAAMGVTLFWAVIGAAGFTAVYFLAGRWLVDRLTDQADLRLAALRFLPWAAALPLISVWSFVFDGVFIGATRTRELMQAMAISFVFFIVCAQALQHIFGNHGLWAALLLFMAMRGITLALMLPRVARELV